MFQFPGFASGSCRMTTYVAGLPHSEILGSINICFSPRLIAAYHVFHRLSKPRHPPCALAYFLVGFALTQSYLSKPMILIVIANMSMYVSRYMRNVISIYFNG